MFLSSTLNESFILFKIRKQAFIIAHNFINISNQKRVYRMCTLVHANLFVILLSVPPNLLFQSTSSTPQWF